ncbi:uncharacterized protein PGTG_02473 [Puccinia graminis f. sp. tritici CRL 75-36-700-3]|uniref:DNA 3'-5' helicase n=1 Tax=Puccinia graminis f. sp. tritici (strain CRL 75-36-700-3 / race SCCL) TaxID=418459 RepID=E3JY87_PUCGT|nr:uncharacterized protein PGTG_02473 [Puccinia graminis f. sp. tritici CRL 75-36-700-3]EFP77012.1 hypothetical protein PGTG_02473 [Puccinia graminis f. sp. tritici CRL 75-36-700-3]
MSIQSRIQSALEQFVSLAMLNEDGSCMPPLHLCHTIAGLQYGIRLGVMYHWLAVSRSIVSANDLSNDDEVTAMENHFGWITHDKWFSPFQSLRDWMRLASSAVLNQQQPNATRWEDLGMTKLVIGSTAVHLTGIRTALRAALTLLRTLMQSILKGCSLPDCLVSTLEDKSENLSTGYNYMEEKKSKAVLNDRMKILRDWMHNGNPHSVLAGNWQECLMAPGLALPDLIAPWAAWKWLEMVDQVVEIIYFLYHVGCGQPARGTEESCMLIRNSDTAPRNIYWRGTQMMFQTWYHKGQNISQRSKPRQVYLTGELSMHLHTYLAFIRPTQMFLLRGLGEKTNAIDMQEFLWMGSRIGRLETPDFSRILKKYFLHGGCEGVGIRVWRQAAVSIAAAHLSKKIPAMLLPNSESLQEDLAEDLGLQTVMDLQRNHSTTTANHLYGYSSGSGVMRDEELNFKLASQVWQAFWGIESLWASKQPPLPVPDTLPPGEKARQALTIFTRNPNALFRSEFQHLWLTELFRSDLEDMLVVAKTGGGKSLAYCLPPLVLPHERLVLIQPLKALVSQSMKQLEQLDGVKSQLYTPHTPIDETAQVILALADHACKIDFHMQLRIKQPTRIIIDEVHTFMEDKFRSYIPGIVSLGQLSTQMVLMTGSLPPSQESELLHTILSRTRLTTKREITFRPELQIDVQPKYASTANLVPILQGLTQSHILKKKDRAMIFIEHRESVALIAQAVGGLMHHSGMSDEEQSQSASKWLKRDHGIMVATSGFGAGIDYPHVRLVVIWGLPSAKEANKTYQEIGRAGRDGKQARIVLIPRFGDVPSGRLPNFGVDDFKRSLLNPAACAAQVFARLQDSIPHSCRNYEGFNRCGPCAKMDSNQGKRAYYELDQRHQIKCQTVATQAVSQTPSGSTVSLINTSIVEPLHDPLPQFLFKPIQEKFEQHLSFETPSQLVLQNDPHKECETTPVNSASRVCHATVLGSIDVGVTEQTPARWNKQVPLPQDISELRVPIPTTCLGKRTSGNAVVDIVNTVEQSMILEPLERIKRARVAEHTRLAAEENPVNRPEQPRSINQVDHLRAQGGEATVQHEGIQLLEFVRKIKGNCIECFLRTRTYVPEHKKCSFTNSKCLRCRESQGWNSGHTVRLCPAARFSTALMEGSRGNSYTICNRCALPSGTQDRIRFHENNKFAAECNTGFANMAEAVGWFVYREKKEVLAGSFDGIGDLDVQKYAKWLGVTNKAHGPGPWPNAIKLVLAFLRFED